MADQSFSMCISYDFASPGEYPKEFTDGTCHVPTPIKGPVAEEGRIMT
ncbi:hypothetical protein ACIPSJ_22285 [Streptomyces sp. NPDC090088]